MDINAKNVSGTSPSIDIVTDGLIITRVDRQRAEKMTTVQASILIYVNNIATGSQTGKALNIGQTAIRSIRYNNL